MYKTKICKIDYIRLFEEKKHIFLALIGLLLVFRALLWKSELFLPSVSSANLRFISVEELSDTLKKEDAGQIPPLSQKNKSQATASG